MIREWAIDWDSLRSTESCWSEDCINSAGWGRDSDWTNSAGLGRGSATVSASALVARGSEVSLLILKVQYR